MRLEGVLIDKGIDVFMIELISPRGGDSPVDMGAWSIVM